MAMFQEVFSVGLSLLHGYKESAGTLQNVEHG